MLAFNKYIQRPLLLFCILFLVSTVVFFPVFAADDEHPNYFYDFDDYATYSVDSSTGLISADIKLPSDWLWLCAIDRDGYQSWYNGTDYVVIEPSDSPYSWRFNPFFRFHAVNPGVGYQLNDARFLDLNFIPSGSYFDVDFYYLISSGTDSTYRVSDMYLVYVDSQGVVVSTDRIEADITVTSVESSVRRYEVSARYYFSNVPQNAEGFYYSINISHGFAVVGIDIPVSSVTNKLTFKYSELDFNIKQNQLIRDKVSNIDKQLGELPGQIGNEFESVIEQEKEESKEEGNKFVDQILDALPDPSQDVLAALKGLTDATAYSGTDAVLPIPAIVLPGIDGLFPETEIWGGTEFDFGEYVRLLPPALLTLVQALFTIAIVLFCVYELKGIISYCLTLRESKGG